MQQNLSEDITRLNQQQLDMLRLFQSPMNEHDYNEIKRFVVKTLAKNIDDEMESMEKEKGWTQETYEQWGREHMRIPYKK
jgi:hypothetical protein